MWSNNIVGVAGGGGRHGGNKRRGAVSMETEDKKKYNPLK